MCAMGLDSLGGTSLLLRCWPHKMHALRIYHGAIAEAWAGHRVYRGSQTFMYHCYCTTYV